MLKDIYHTLSIYLIIGTPLMVIKYNLLY